MIYGSWDMKGGRQNFVILSHFLPFYLTKISKNLCFEKKKKKTRRYHNFTLVHQKSLSYAILFLRYGAWQIIFDFGLFCPLPLNSPKNQNQKKKKENSCPEISSFYTSVAKIMTIWYTILVLRYGAWRMQLLFFMLGYFLYF